MYVYIPFTSLRLLKGARRGRTNPSARADQRLFYTPQSGSIGVSAGHFIGV